MKQIITVSKLRLGFTIWFIGMAGVFSLLLILPAMLKNQSTLPLWLLFLNQVAQSGFILAIFAWLGATFAYKVNLHAPSIEALILKQSFYEKIRPQFFPACFVGIVAALFIYGLSFLRPKELSIAALNINPIFTILTGVLYGGLTEEILLRWGVMTYILWLLWRFFQHKQDSPSPKLVWIAIIGSSLLFSIAHLPSAYILAGQLSIGIFFYVMVGNTVAGMMFGFLYQRFGLESAMIAHALAHLIGDPLIIYA